MKAIMVLLYESGQKLKGPWDRCRGRSSMRRGQTDVTKMLLALGADPNATGTGAQRRLPKLRSRAILRVSACYLRTAAGKRHK